MDRGDDERSGAEAGVEDAGLPTEPDPNAATIDAGGRHCGVSSKDPSGLDDPANMNAYQGRSGTARGAGGV